MDIPGQRVRLNTGERLPIYDRHERFDALYQKFEHRLLGYALRRAPVETAKDAVAETFLAAWRRLDELPEDPLPWLVETTRRTLANQARSSRRQSRVAAAVAMRSGERLNATLPDVVQDLAVRAAFRRLRPTDREALALIAWDGLTPSQAARSLGCSPVAFRVRFHRARSRFARALAEVEGKAQMDAPSPRDGVGDVA